MAKRELEIVISGNAADAKRALQEVDGHLDNFGSKLATVGKLAAGAAVVGIGALVAGLGFSVKAAMESEEAQAQLNAVLKSTGGIAGQTAAALNKHATALQSVTRFNDESISAGQSMLLTFTKIGGDVFPKATEAMLDYAQAMGTGPKEAALQLGKALNDPIDGVTKLSRAGVQFSDEQVTTIKRLQEMGDMAGAQTVILKELEVQFGGSARAAGATLGGQLDRLKNAFGDIGEEIGGALLPYLSQAVSWFLDRLPAALETARAKIGGFLQSMSSIGKLTTSDDLGETTEAFAKLHEEYGGLFTPEQAQAVLNATQVLQGFSDVVTGKAGGENFLRQALEDFMTHIGIAMPQIEGLIEAIVRIATTAADTKLAVEGLAGAISETLNPATDEGRQMHEALGGAIGEVLKLWVDMQTLARDLVLLIVSTVLPSLSDLGESFSGIGADKGGVLGFLRGFTDYIHVARQAVNLMIGAVQGLINIMLAARSQPPITIGGGGGSGGGGSSSFATPLPTSGTIMSVAPSANLARGQASNVVNLGGIHVAGGSGSPRQVAEQVAVEVERVMRRSGLTLQRGVV